MGPRHELDVTLGIDVIQRLPCDFGDVLHVHIFVDDYDALC